MSRSQAYRARHDAERLSFIADDTDTAVLFARHLAHALGEWAAGGTRENSDDLLFAIQVAISRTLRGERVDAVRAVDW